MRSTFARSLLVYPEERRAAPLPETGLDAAFRGTGFSLCAFAGAPCSSCVSVGLAALPLRGTIFSLCALPS